MIIWASRAEDVDTSNWLDVSHLFFIFADPETPSRCLAGKLNQEIPFAFLCRHAEDYIFSLRAADPLSHLTRCFRCIALSLSALHSARCEIFTGWDGDQCSQKCANSLSKCNIQLIWICDFRRMHWKSRIRSIYMGEGRIFLRKSICKQILLLYKVCVITHGIRHLIKK